MWRLQVAGVAEGIGSVRRFDGILVALTNLPDATLNTAFVDRSPRDPARALARVESWFALHRQRIGLDLRRGRHPDVEAAAADLGMRPLVSRPGMALKVEAFASPPSPPGLTIRRVTSGGALRRFREVQVEVFGFDSHVAERFLAPRALRMNGVAYYLASLDGQAVGCAATYRADRSIGIFGVGTIPEARGRGVGTALTARAVAASRGRADLAWLQASDAGLPVYERMGFRTVGEWVVWTRP